MTNSTIRRGTAIRLGLHRQHYLPVASIDRTPRGPLRVVSSLRSRRTILVDERGHAVADAGVTVTAGMIRDDRPMSSWASVPTGPTGGGA